MGLVPFIVSEDMCVHRPSEAPGSLLACLTFSPPGSDSTLTVATIMMHPPTPLIEDQLYSRPNAKCFEILHLVLTTPFIVESTLLTLPRKEEFKVQLFT